MFSLNKTRRRIIFWLAVCFFVIAAPLVIAYSQGLRFDFATRQIVRVGAISLDSEPDEATIYFNGEIYSSDTPSVIRGLLPGHLYHIKVDLENYYSWEKTLTVEAQRITSARGIHLFPREIVFDDVASGTPEVSKSYPNAQGESFFVEGPGGLHVFSLETSTSTPVSFPDLQRTSEISNIEWHQDGIHILFSRRTTSDLIWYVLDTENNALLNLNQVYSSVSEGADESLNLPDELDATNIFFLRNGATRFIVSLEGRLYILNTSSSAFTEIGIDSVALLYSSGNRFFVVNGESNLVEIDANGNITKSYGTLGFIPERLLLSPNGQRLFYESNGRGEVIWLQEQELDWHRDVGDVDVIFEHDTSPISVWWHSSSAYIIALENESELVAYEIDVRDVQNVHSWDMSRFNSLSYIQQGSHLFGFEGGVLRETPQEF